MFLQKLLILQYFSRSTRFAPSLGSATVHDFSDFRRHRFVVRVACCPLFLRRVCGHAWCFAEAIYLVFSLRFPRLHNFFVEIFWVVFFKSTVALGFQLLQRAKLKPFPFFRGEGFNESQFPDLPFKNNTSRSIFAYS